MTVQIHKIKATIDLSTLRNLATVDNLKRKDYKVLIYLLSHLDSMRPRKINKKHICREIEMEKKEFDKALGNLVESGIIIHSQDIEEGYMFR